MDESSLYYNGDKKFFNDPAQKFNVINFFLFTSLGGRHFIVSLRFRFTDWNE